MPIIAVKPRVMPQPAARPLLTGLLIGASVGAVTLRTGPVGEGSGPAVVDSGVDSVYVDVVDGTDSDDEGGDDDCNEGDDHDCRSKVEISSTELLKAVGEEELAEKGITTWWESTLGRVKYLP